MKRPEVYLTREITPASLVKIYEQLGVPAEGRVGVKISLGEPGNPNYLKPELIKDLVRLVDGVIIESNTAYGGGRGDTANHLQVAKDHGFTEIAEIDIMDADGEIELPIKGGHNLGVDPVGQNLAKYDTIINLAHFKGHGVAGFGGVLKNQSIGIASIAGKAYIHTAGATRDAEKFMACFTENPPADLDVFAIQDQFLESMAEAAKAVSDYLRDKTGRENPILYINVLNNISRDCDCDAEPEAVNLPDLGIIASLDPVAADQASLDQILALTGEGRDAFAERLETQNGAHILQHAAELGLGSREYELIEID